eukprot:Em0199g6a
MVVLAAPIGQIHLASILVEEYHIAKGENPATPESGTLLSGGTGTLLLARIGTSLEWEPVAWDGNNQNIVEADKAVVVKQRMAAALVVAMTTAAALLTLETRGKRVCHDMLNGLPALGTRLFHGRAGYKTYM